MCLAYVGIACCLKGGLLFSFREGPQGLEPHALPGAARPSGCNGRKRERKCKSCLQKKRYRLPLNIAQSLQRLRSFCAQAMAVEYCADDDDDLDTPEGPDEAAKATTTGVGPET